MMVNRCLTATGPMYTIKQIIEEVIMKKLVVGDVRYYRNNKIYVYDPLKGASMHHMSLDQLADTLECDISDIYKIYFNPRSDVIACETEYNTFIIKEPNQDPYEVTDSEYVFIKLIY